MVRNIGAVLAGMVVVGAVVAGLQYAGLLLYPLPAGLDPLDPADAEAFAEFLAGMPLAMWAWVFGSEILGAFLGALAAGRIANHHHSWFAGGIVALAVAASINNWVSFSHPTWFIVGQLVAYALVFLAVTSLLGRHDQPD